MRKNYFSGLAAFFLLSAVSMLVSCSDGSIVSSSRSGESEGKVGTVRISTGDKSRSLDVSSIKSARVVVSGTGIEGDLSCEVGITGGKNNADEDIVIENVPTGANRVISVYARDEDGKELFGGAIRNVKNIGAGLNTCSVTKATTALGNVFYYLKELGYPISSVAQAEKTTIESAIDSTYSFDKINTQSIARDFYTSGVSGLKDKKEYVLGESSGTGSATSVTVYAKGYEYIHYWETGKDGTSVQMSAATDKGTDWYTITLNYTSINLLFKTKEDWSGSKTDDMSRTSGVWYYENGEWSGSAIEDDVNPVVTWLRPSSLTVSGKTELFAFAEDENGIEKIEFYAQASESESPVLIGSTDGTSALLWDSSALNNGTYTLTAKAYDNGGNTTSSSTISVLVQNVIPVVAVISANSSATVGVEKSFDASSSTGDITNYTWDFGDGTTGSGAKVKHTYSTKNKYTVTLTVTGTEGFGSSAVTKTSAATKEISVADKTDFVHRDFREETVYFMMTDRFADGDSTNNNIWGDEFLPAGKGVYDFEESKTGALSYYHGGDFKGIIENLDYIADMGFTAIWITPSVKQPEGRYFYDGSGGGDPYQASAFHGYWGYDFDQIDPHLHSSGKDSDGWADYKAFIDACHAKGIRVMQDIVINHGIPSSPSSPTTWENYSVQTIMDGKKWAWQTLDPYYEPVPEDATPSKNGFYSYYGFGECAGLIDFGHLGEDGKDSRHHLINVYKKFIDAGVDAFRIDTMAYIPSEFAGEFADAMYNYAKELGNDYFYMIGEAWCDRYTAVQRHAKDTTDSLHMLDMHLSCLDYPGEMQKAFKDGDAIGSVYNNVISRGDNQFTCMTADEYTKTAMFVDNHDCYRLEGLISEEKYKNALNYIYLFRGVPIVFYGTEAMYSWEGTHPCTNKDDVVSRWMLGDRGINYVKQNKPSMYKHLKILNQIYHSSECIQKGAQENVSINTIPAAFTRTWNGKTAAVLLNHQDRAGSYSFSGLPSGTYTLYTSDGSGTLNTSTVTVSGSYTLDAPANGFAVLDPQ